jgi:hypothetical protein
MAASAGSFVVNETFTVIVGITVAGDTIAQALDSALALTRHTGM